MREIALESGSKGRGAVEKADNAGGSRRGYAELLRGECESGWLLRREVMVLGAGGGEEGQLDGQMFQAKMSCWPA